MWHSFAGRIVLGGAAIHIVLIPFLFTGVLLIVAKGYKEQFVQYVRHDAAQCAEQLSEATARPYLQRYLDEMALSGRTVYARLVLPGGTALSAAGSRSGLPFQEDFYFGEHGDGVYFISLPVAMGGALATLYLGYDEATAQQQIQSAYERGTLLAIAYILLSLLLVGSSSRSSPTRCASCATPPRESPPARPWSTSTSRPASSRSRTSPRNWSACATSW